MELTHNDMRSLYDHFTGVPDVRRAKGRKHNLANVLALAAGATLSGMRGYKDIWVWASTLSEASRTRFRCRFRNRRREVPSLTVIRNVMIQVGPEALDRALNNWLAEHYGDAHESIAVDGKTMRGAVVDNEGQQVHVMSAVGHGSKHCYTQKKVGTLPVNGSDEQKRTNEIKTVAPMLDAFDITGRTITADALHTQREFANTWSDVAHTTTSRRKKISRPCWTMYGCGLSRAGRRMMSKLTLSTGASRPAGSG